MNSGTSDRDKIATKLIKETQPITESKLSSPHIHALYACIKRVSCSEEALRMRTSNEYEEEYSLFL